MLQKIKLFLSKGNRAQWCVFFLFAFTIFVKCILFHWECFHSILISSLWAAPYEFIMFWWNKIIPALMLGSFVFISKRYWWTILVNILVDIWIIANLVYYQANECFLDINAILMAYNLSGFESSIKTFINISFVTFPILTIIYTLFLHSSKNLYNKKRNYNIFLLILGICILSHICSVAPDWKKNYYNNKYAVDFDMLDGLETNCETFGWNGIKMYIPFHDIKLYALPYSFSYCPEYAKEYIRATSILHYSISAVVYYVYSENDKSIVIDPKCLRNFINMQSESILSPKSNLIIILVESFESWALEQGALSKQAASNFLSFMDYNNIFYAKQITSEVKQGVSGDGQMIVNTGLLPIFAGAACIRYGNNTYPNIASNYNHSVLVNISDDVWNQHQMTTKYGYQYEFFCKGGISEPEMFQNMLNVLDTIEEPFCLLGITITMHSPFDKYKIKHLNMPQSTPYWMGEYMECLYYTDSCFGVFWNSLKDKEILNNTTIVITGDHTVFKRNILHEFSSFASNSGLEIPAEKSFVPLIIYSPQINESIQVTDTCYQMDIYPTIMHLIGCEDYYWKGFGVNLLDSAAIHNRQISEQEAYELSDKLIRSNYFATIKQ